MRFASSYRFSHGMRKHVRRMPSAGMLLKVCGVLLLLLMIFMPTRKAAGEETGRFAVYYSDKATFEHFAPYRLLVLDSLYHPPLRPLSEQGKLLLGYVSLGEAEEHRPYFAMLKNSKLLLTENRHWKGSHIVNLRDAAWTKRVIEEIIPSVLRQGFDGVFFDTLDSPLEMERAYPKQYKGMKESAVHLIRAVRLHYPSIKIMVNRAYPLLPEIAPHIDMVLGESVYGDYDFDKKQYRRVEEPLYRQQVQWLQEARKYNPKLAVYTLDYADRDDRAAIAEIYRVQRANGFTPYVATIGLDDLVDEPPVP